MSYTESIIAGTGMQEVLEKGFGSIPKLLTGKKYTQRVHVICLLNEE